MKVETTFNLKRGGSVTVTFQTDLDGHSTLSMLKQGDIIPWLREAVSKVESLAPTDG